MLLTFASLFIISWSGHAAVQNGARLYKVQIDPFLSSGTGFFFSTACVIVWLNNTALSVNTASWALVGLAAFALAFSAMKRPANLIYPHTALLNLRSAKSTGLVLIVVLYLGLAAVMQASSEVFAWDAFTTWMFRAKAWVTTAVDFETIERGSQVEQEAMLRGSAVPNLCICTRGVCFISSGEWRLMSAGMPWLFAALASGAIMFGLCWQLTPDNFLAPTIGALLLMTTPLFQVHTMLLAMLIQVQGTSGLGSRAFVFGAKTDPYATSGTGLQV